MKSESATERQPRWVAIQRNRSSGAGRQYRPLRELIDELRRHGLRPQLFSRRESLDARLADPSVPPPSAIVAAGGDGTVLDLLNRHPHLPVAILPLGTENLLARHLGIPRRDGKFVARMVARGRSREIDLGTLGDRRFAIVASCGLDSAVLQSAHLARAGNVTRLHYVRPVLGRLWDYDYPVLRVFLDGSERPIMGGMVLVANIAQYALNLPLVPRADPADGLLHVRVFPHHSMFQLARDLGNVLVRWGGDYAGCETYTAARVRIESDRPLAVQADGDPAGRTPVEIGILPAAATLVTP